jgi:hypothetical protein
VGTSASAYAHYHSIGATVRMTPPEYRTRVAKVQRLFSFGVTLCNDSRSGVAIAHFAADAS